jgi:predicted dehydrogenase
MLDSSGGFTIRAVCDTDQGRLRKATQLAYTETASCFGDWRDAVADPEIEALLVLTPDDTHCEIAAAAFRAGKHVFLEKPLATTMADGQAIVAAWIESGRVLNLGYVLREAPFYRAIADTLARGTIGVPRMIEMSEQLGVLHGASFMRRWHHASARSGGLMNHKGCHDLDLACWLAGALPARIASFGGRDIFARAAPAEYCSQCPERSQCPYADTGLYEFRTDEQIANPTAFGLDRCVYSPEADLVDNQVVMFEFENGLRGAFTLTMQGPESAGRRITIVGDRGRLSGHFERGRFRIEFNDGREPQVWDARGGDSGGHGGGDPHMLAMFLEQCRGLRAPTLTPTDALAGFSLAMAAEEARREGTVVHLSPTIYPQSASA